MLIPHPTEADIVRTIFDKFVYQGLDAFEIIKWLHENNINPRRVDNWSCKGLRRLLRNKTYIGYIAVDYVNGSPTRYIDGLHNGIIDIDTFNLAQEKLETKRTKVQYDRTLVNPLASILKCSKCGRTMQSRFSTNKHHYFLRCPNLKCDTVSNVLEPVERQVISEISECLHDYELYVENHDDEIEREKQRIETEKNLILKEITRKESMINRCDEMLEEGIYSKEKYINRTKSLEKDLSALRESLKELESRSYSDIENKKNAIPIMSKVLEEYWNLSATDKNKLLKSIIDKIEYTKTERNTRYNPDEVKFTLKIFLKI